MTTAPEICFIWLNGRRCSSDEFVLAVRDGDDDVHFAQHDRSDLRQAWSVQPVWAANRYSGVVFTNEYNNRAIRFDGRERSLVTSPFHEDQQDPSYVWVVDAAEEGSDYEGCCLLWTATLSDVIDAKGDNCCDDDAVIQAHSVNRSGNQWWRLRDD